MQRRLSPYVLLPPSALIVLAIAWTQAPPPRSNGCSTDAAFRQWVYEGARAAATSVLPGADEWRDSLRIGTVADTAIAVVADEARCMQAGTTMNAHEGRPITEPRAVALVRVGSRYWAEDKGLRVGEYNLVFILDTTLTDVLSVNGH